MKKIRYALIIILSIIIIVNLCVGQAIAVEVTDENLKTALQDFVSSSANESDFDITVENNAIKIKTDGEEYVVNYSLDSKPTFWVEIPVKQGMSYNEFQTQTNNLSLPMVGYLAVANIQGISWEDSLAYFGMNLLMQAFGAMGSTDSNYVIVDDANSEGNVTVGDGKKVIKQSEFGEHVMEFVNDTYKNGSTITDSEGINSFEWKTEQQNADSTSCTLKATLTINMSADFSQLDGYAESMGGSTNNTTNDFIDVGVTSNDSEENEDTWDNVNVVTNSNSSSSNNNSNSNNSSLPKTGINNYAIFLVAGVGILILICIVQICRYKDVK